MKKILTLLFAVVLVSAAAFAQDGRHRYSNNSYDNSWQQQYPPVKGYAYSSPYGRTSNYYSYRQLRERQAYLRMMRRHQRLNDRRYYDRYYDNYGRTRTGVLFQITLGNRRPLY